MDSISLPLPVGTSQQKVRGFEEKAQSAPRSNWTGLVLPVAALVLWLLVGISLSWLVRDFNRSLAPESSVISPGLILLLFITFAVVIGRFFWNSRRNAPSR